MIPRGILYYSNDELPFSLAISSGVYGYKDTSNNFHSFKSQADIDSAIAAARVGTAGTAQVLSGYTFTNSSSSGLNGSMTNQGKKTYTINPGGSQTIPEGYHNGQGSVTANANQNSGTYTFASGSTGSTVDLGINNTYRYVNASNVYNKGKADGKTISTLVGKIICRRVYDDEYRGIYIYDVGTSESTANRLYWNEFYLPVTSGQTVHWKASDNSGISTYVCYTLSYDGTKSSEWGFYGTQDGTRAITANECLVLGYGRECPSGYAKKLWLT